MIASELISWYGKNKRELPWRNTKDPYKIWLSEIILQQTRVAQGLPYYLKFVEAFPDVRALAKAPQQRVLKLWQGLGYYSRARNLHAAAKQIVNECGGKFPKNFTDLKKLKGVGDYTAAAIASFCFNQPNAVVDTNVFRVLSRLHGIDTPINSPEGKKLFAELAQQLLHKKDPATYNQAIMEFGAQYCTPHQPDCANCIFSETCVAARTNTVAKLPVKIAAAKPVTRHFEYFFLTRKTQTYIQQRGAGDIWQGLYQLPLIEFKKKTARAGVLKKFSSEITSAQVIVRKIVPARKHQLSHQTIMARFWHIDLKTSAKMPGFKQISIASLKKYPFPVLLGNHFKEITIFD